MTDNEHLYKIKQLAVMKELPILDEEQLMKLQLDACTPLDIEENNVTAHIPITFNADKVFGLDICNDAVDDTIDLHAEWRIGDASTLTMKVKYNNNSTLDGDFYLSIPLDERQKQRVHARLEEQCHAVYGKFLADREAEEAKREKAMTMTKDKFWAVIDNARAKAVSWEKEPLQEQLYKQLLKLSQEELVGFDHAWQEYCNIVKSPRLFAAACVINNGSSNELFDYFKNWLIMQGQYAFRQALKDPDTLAALNIPFDNTEWKECENLAPDAFAGKAISAYFEQEGISEELHRKYPILLQEAGALDDEIMRVLLYPSREPSQAFDRYLLHLEVQHCVHESKLEYSYAKSCLDNSSCQFEWNYLRESIRAEAPNLHPKKLDASIASALPKLWEKRLVWEDERMKKLNRRGQER